MPDKLANFLFTSVGVPKLGAYLDLGAFRHKLISGNVANVSTPGYRSRDLDFQAEFARLTSANGHLAGTRTHRRHMAVGQQRERPPRVHEARVPAGELNSVDVEKEVTAMARNELEYTIAARMLQRKFQALKNAITSK